MIDDSDILDMKGAQKLLRKKRKGVMTLIALGMPCAPRRWHHGYLFSRKAILDWLASGSPKWESPPVSSGPQKPTRTKQRRKGEVDLAAFNGLSAV